MSDIKNRGRGLSQQIFTSTKLHRGITSAGLPAKGEGIMVSKLKVDLKRAIDSFLRQERKGIMLRDKKQYNRLMAIAQMQKALCFMPRFLELGGVLEIDDRLYKVVYVGQYVVQTVCLLSGNSRELPVAKLAKARVLAVISHKTG